MMMSAAGLQSLNALESELRVGGRWENLVGRRKPSADSLARIVGFDGFRASAQPALAG